MKSNSVLLAGLVSALMLAGCAAHRDGYYRDSNTVRYSPAPADRYVERGRYSALELYSRPEFRGETMKFDRDGTSLDRMVANDGIASIVVNEGRWELCTGARFGGECRVYEPGRYGRLGPLEGAPVNSLRRIG